MAEKDWEIPDWEISGKRRTWTLRGERFVGDSYYKIRWRGDHPIRLILRDCEFVGGDGIQVLVEGPFAQVDITGGEVTDSKGGFILGTNESRLQETYRNARVEGVWIHDLHGKHTHANGVISYACHSRLDNNTGESIKSDGGDANFLYMKSLGGSMSNNHGHNAGDINATYCLKGNPKAKSADGRNITVTGNTATIDSTYPARPGPQQGITGMIVECGNAVVTGNNFDGCNLWGGLVGGYNLTGNRFVNAPYGGICVAMGPKSQSVGIQGNQVDWLQEVDRKAAIVLLCKGEVAAPVMLAGNYGQSNDAYEGVYVQDRKKFRNLDERNNNFTIA